MVTWAGEAGMGTHVSINNGITQTLFSDETKLQKNWGNKKPELEVVSRHIRVSSEAHNFIRLRDY